MDYKESYTKSLEYIKKKKYGHAIYVLTEMKNVYKEDILTRKTLASIYKTEKNYEKSKNNYIEIMQILAKKLQTCISHAKIYADSNNEDLFNNCFDKAKSISNDCNDYRNKLKNVCILDKDKNMLEKIKKEELLSSNADFFFNFSFGVGDTSDTLKLLDDFLVPFKDYLPKTISFKDFLEEHFEEIDMHILQKYKYKPKPTKEEEYDLNGNLIIPSAKKKTIYPEELSLENRCKFFLEHGFNHGHKGKNDEFFGYRIILNDETNMAILEKFYEDKESEEKGIEATENATYIFPQGVMLTLSQFSKADIISMMQSQGYLQRVLHTKNYYNNLLKKLELSKSEYDKYVTQKEKTQKEILALMNDENDLER